MAGYIKGITIEFGADVKGLNDGLKDVQKNLSATQQEIKSTTRGLKFNPTSTTLLQQKFDLLNREVGETTEKLDQLKQMKNIMDEKGVDKTTDQYKQLEREIERTEEQLKQAENELKEFGSIGKQQALAVGEAMKTAGGKIGKVGKTMSTKVSAPLTAGFVASAKYASDLEENMNKVDVAFGDSADAVKAWAETSNAQFGLSMVQATDAASAFGALGKGIGLSEAEAAGMATTLAGLSSDLGSYFNVGIDQSSKALEGIFTGESEALKKFGVVMTDTNLKQFAKDQGLVWSEMSQAEKTQLRYNYVLEKTKDAQGDFSRTSDGTANTLKIFQASLQDLGASFGEVLLPIITPIIQHLASLIQKFGELNPTVQRIIVIVGMVVAAIGPVLVVVGTLVSAIGAIIPVAIAVGSAFAAVAAPVLGVAAAIAAAIAIGVLLYKNWDKIKAKASEIFSSVKSTFAKLKDAISKPFTDAWNKIKKVWDKLKGLFPLKIGKIFSNLKIPHIKIKGGKAPFGIGGLGTKPSISISWHKKAMENPYLFSNATLFGAGEAGDEVLYGRRALMRDIAEAVAGRGGGQIIMNVYGSEGMSVNELASAVERKLIQAQNRRTQAWA